MQTVSIGELHDSLVNFSADGRAPHRSIVRGSKVAVSDVVCDRIVEKHRVLRDNANDTPQRFLSDSGDILPIHTNDAAGDIVKPEE
jgi:hypothetical protein